MSARHALLGLLLERPAYPYDLGNRLERLLGPTWAINPGQLSHTLKAMRRDGLILPLDDAPKDRKGRKLDSITDLGIEELERWRLTDSPDGAPLPRRPLLVKLALAGPEQLRECLELIKTSELEYAERLKEIARRHDEVPAGPEVRRDQVLLRLSLRGDMFRLEGELAWARYAHEVVSWLLTREAIWPGPREPEGAMSMRDRRDVRERVFARMAARHLQIARDREAGAES